VTLAVTNAQLGGATVGLRAADGAIVALGPDVTPDAGDDVLDGTGRALLPGLVNGHGHAAMTLLRGYGADLTLQQWLETSIWPIEAKLTAGDVYWGTRLACVEMIRSGTVHFWDMYWHPVAVARAVHDSGMRATVSEVLVDGRDETRGTEVRRAAVDGLAAMDEFAPRVKRALGPHSIYTVSSTTLRWCAEHAAANDLPIHIHLSETRSEVDDCVEAHGQRPAEYLDQVGLLTPGALLAHGVWLDERELHLIADRGSTIVTNPVSNLKLAVGRIFPYPDAAGRGIPLGLGTDGAASNNSLDLFQDMKFLALVQKHAAADPSMLPAAETWAIATGQRSALLGQEGRIAIGEPADFLLVGLDAPELNPGDLQANLVYAASGSVVDATVVAGRVLMRDGVVENAEEVRAEAAACAHRLGIIP
jgi:5-methylthioadenosine/S-adenosylhomocysteine deaminase